MFLINFKIDCIKNKKVLLRERKRHTAHRVVSTHAVVLYWLTPPLPADPPLLAGLTLPGWTDLPPPAGLTHPPSWTDPHPPSSWTDPPQLSQLTDPPPRCGQTENITFPHPSDVGGNKKDLLWETARGIPPTV